MLIGSGAAAQAVDEERPPADEAAAKQKQVPAQEAGDTSEVSITGEAPSPAAAEKTEKPPISMAVALGWGTDFESVDYNLYSVGFGVRGGYTLDFGLYLGGQALYFIGDSVSVAGVEASGNELLLGVDVGYDIDVAPLIIRPSLGLGAALTFSKSDIGKPEAASETNANFYVAPGATAMYPISNFFIGGDLRFIDIFASDSVEGVTIMVVGGMNFGKRK
jgi:hypothetical protein